MERCARQLACVFDLYRGSRRDALCDSESLDTRHADRADDDGDDDDDPSTASH
jgi:hypothetical protein